MNNRFTVVTGSVPSGPASDQVLRLTLRDTINMALRYDLGAIESGQNAQIARGQRLLALSVTVEYRVDLDRRSHSLDAIHEYQRVRRRDGATQWGVFYDAEIPGRYLDSFLVDSWAEHQRQHDRFIVADRKLEDRVSQYVLEPPKIRHFIYAERESSFR